MYSLLYIDHEPPKYLTRCSVTKYSVTFADPIPISRYVSEITLRLIWVGLTAPWVEEELNL